MFNLFPDLLNYGFFAPIIIRVGLAIVFLDLCQKSFTQPTDENYISRHVRMNKTRSEWWKNRFSRSNQELSGILALLFGLFLLIGLYTQAVSIFIILVWGISNNLPLPSKLTSWQMRVLVTVASLSLLLTGAGAFALDWPL